MATKINGPAKYVFVLTKGTWELSAFGASPALASPEAHRAPVNPKQGNRP